MKTLTTNQVEMINKIIKDNHALQINNTTSRTIDYNGCGWGDDVDYTDLNPSSDENIKDIGEYIEQNRLPILHQMIFNDKEFIVIGKEQGKLVEYKQKSNITGNKITIKFTSLYGARTITESTQTIYRTK